MATLSSADAPGTLRKGAGRCFQPVALVVRLGVSLEHEGRGLGTGLLQDVIGRTAQHGIEIGGRGLPVHTESSEARDFSLHLVPALEAPPTDDFHLVLLVKDLLETFAR